MTDNATRLRRLRRLRLVVAKLIPRGRFNMNFWAKDENECSVNPEELKLKRSCGTAGCAAGWYAAIGGRKAKDLRTVMTPSNNDIVGSTPFVKLARHFKIEMLECYGIFDPGYYTTGPIPRRRVLRKIDALIKKYSACKAS